MFFHPKIAHEIDDNTLFQVKNLANLPFAFKHIALMPDAHSGYGMPIGGRLIVRKAKELGVSFNNLTKKYE